MYSVISPLEKNRVFQVTLIVEVAGINSVSTILGESLGAEIDQVCKLIIYYTLDVQLTVSW